MRRVAQDRDETAFVDLFEIYAPRIKGYLMRGGATETQAEEAMQETMAALWRKAVQFNPERAGVSAWIFAIARNQRIDALRRERRPDFDPSDPSLSPEPPSSPDAHLHAEQMAEQVKIAVAALPPNQRKLIQMAFFEHQPHSAIAESLGLPLGTVKSRIRLAFQKLRCAIIEQVGGPE